MTQSILASRILDRNRLPLAANDTEIFVTNKATVFIYAAVLEMNGGQDILTTDAYSHAYRYEGRAGTFDVDRQGAVINEVSGTVLVYGTIVDGARRQCGSFPGTVDSLIEIVNTGGSSFGNPTGNINSGFCSESQVGLRFADLEDRDGAVVIMTIRTAIAIGGGAETDCAAKFRFPKPPVDYSSFPNPAMSR